MKHITRHLLEILNVKNFKLRFFRDIVNKFRSIEIETYNVHDRGDIFDKELKKKIDNLYGLTPEQVEFFFNEVKTDKLSFYGYISNPEELIEIQLKHRVVEVWNRGSLDYVTMDHVIDSESEEVCVKFEGVEVVKVVELLKKWQSGEKSVNLKRLDLSNVGEDEHQPLIEMLDKLEGVEKYPNQEADVTRQKIYQEEEIIVVDFFFQKFCFQK